MRPNATDPTDTERRTRWIRAATPIGLCVVLAAPFLGPFRTAAAASLAAGLVVLAGLAAVNIAHGVKPSGYRLHAILVAGCATAVMTLSAAFAPNPWVSVFGLVGQRAGALTWLVAFGFFVITIVDRRRTTTLGVARVIAGAGAVYALIAMVQAAGIIPSLIGVWGAASGPLENSSSLGSLLVLATGASGVAWSAARTRPQRIGWASAAAACVAGVAASSSAGAVAGLAAGIIAAAGLHAARSTDKRIDWAAPAAVIAVLVGVSAAVSAASGLAGTSTAETADALSNLRFTLWRSAAYALRADALVGRGPDQFTAWAQWSLSPTAGLQTQAAHDAHNLILAAAIAAGIPGLLLGAACMAWLGKTALAHWRGAGRPRAIGLSLAALMGWSTTLLFTWISPPSLFAAAALAGACLSALSHREKDSEPVWRPVPAIAVSAAILAISAMVVPSLVTEFRFATRAIDSPDAVLAAAGTAMQTDPHDPTYANAALAVLLKRASGGDTRAVAAARDILESRALDAAWDVDLAANLLTIAPSYPPAQARRRISRAVALGSQADGPSGLWESVAAEASVQIGDPEGARRYAIEALRHPDVEGELRTELTAIVEGD
jgi:O-antigen ligase